MSFLSVLRKKKKKPSPAPHAPDFNSVQSNAREAVKLTQAQKDALRARIERDTERNQHLRNDHRQSCSLISRLEFPDTGIGMDGLVTDASLGGINFRPASRFIQDRSNERVQIILGEISLMGILRRTHPNGYGIQVSPRMTGEQFEEVLAGASYEFG